MVRIALGKLAPQDGCRLDLVCEEAVHPEDEEGGVREVVEAIKRAEVVVLVIILDGFGVLGLLGAIDAPGVNGVDE